MANTVAEAAAAARKAIAIAPKLGPAYAELALIEQDQYNYAKAFKYIERALTLSPDDPLVLPSAMYIKRYLGDPRDALSLADRLVQLDPLNAITYTRRASVLIALRRYPEAIDAARKSLELAPQRTSPHQLIGDCLVLMNRLNDARDEYQKVPADDVFRLAGEAIIAGLSRELAVVNRIIAQMRELFGDAASYNYAQVYAQAGEKDRAFSALSTAFSVRDAGLTGLKTDPFLDPIRSDPRFAALIRKLRFP
jgi:tetratricopeptide (TPR) repeat protein